MPIGLDWSYCNLTIASLAKSIKQRARVNLIVPTSLLWEVETLKIMNSCAVFRSLSLLRKICPIVKVGARPPLM